MPTNQPTKHHPTPATTSKTSVNLVKRRERKKGEKPPQDLPQHFISQKIPGSLNPE